MKGALALAGVAVALASVSDKEDFMSFMKIHKKQYAKEELLSRFEVFQTNLKKIAEHNAKNESWIMGVTEFADLTEDEFASVFKGYNHRENDYLRSQNLHKTPTDFVAADLDWVAKGAVTPVKNQAHCGSCWAFSTTGSIEGANFIANGKLESLSEQELVDCAGSAGNEGCNGGLVDDAFQWIIKENGIATEANYPYRAKKGICLFVTYTDKRPISGFKDINKGDEFGLASALALQPVSIAVDAGSDWQLYKGGVMKNCTGKTLDHAVLLVGSGTDDGTPYWKVKNSWGKVWGERGYIRLKQGMNSCGLADEASYPTVKKPVF